MLRVWAQDCMTRIFPNSKPPEYADRNIYIKSARNEVACFQIGLMDKPENLNHVNVESTDLISEKGDKIGKDKVDILYEGYVPVHWHSANNVQGDLEGQAPGFYPDPLLPFLWSVAGRIELPGTIGVWVRVHIDESQPAGVYRGKVSIRSASANEQIGVEINVLPFSLPKRSHFLMTNWFLIGPILKFHKLDPLTEKFWQVIGKYAKNLSEHRQNVILTPLFCIKNIPDIIDGKIQGQLIDIIEIEPGRYEFDFTNFDKWAGLFFSYNFEILEGSHLAGGSVTPAGILFRRPGSNHAEYRRFNSTLDNEYRDFLQQFLVALRGHLQRKGWLSRFLLHLSDEPHGDQFDAYTSLAKFVKGVTPEFKLIDAMGAVEFAPYIDHPVPLESVYECFVEKSGLPKENIWFYYCCGPTGRWPNRFIDYPLIRVRIFTWIAFKYHIPGFLHWGLNHWDWHPPYYSELAYNPYDNTTGGSLQAGDSFVLYPPLTPSKSDDPVDSIRWEIIRKAMEDYEYLYMLRELSSGGDEEAKRILERLDSQVVPSFTEHTRNHYFLEDFRTQAGYIISQKYK